MLFNILYANVSNKKLWIWSVSNSEAVIKTKKSAHYNIKRLETNEGILLQLVFSSKIHSE